MRINKKDVIKIMDKYNYKIDRLLKRDGGWLIFYIDEVEHLCDIEFKTEKELIEILKYYQSITAKLKEEKK